MQRLLFITPKIHELDDDFAFTSLWAKAFADAGFEVTVICLEKRVCTLPLFVYSLGGELGWSRRQSFWEFQKLITRLPHDRVFVHMNPRWLAAGAWYWALKRIPTYLWYTHYTLPWSLRLSSLIVKRMFAATRDCLPQFEGDLRKVVTGHGIDTRFWDVPPCPEEEREPATHLLAVHRVSRSKRLELVLRALEYLPPEYTLTHYGRPQDPRIDPAYEREIRELASSPALQGRITFMGSRPMPELRQVYPRYRVLVNMVPDTIDKTVLEGMYCGLTPVITPGHAKAIGYPSAPVSEDPKEIAAYIKNMTLVPRQDLRSLVEERHSLPRLIERLAEYIRPGT